MTIQNGRKLASTQNHPLFLCVESKISLAKENVKNKIIHEMPFGTSFFTESHLSPLKEKFFNKFNKYAAEKIVASKMEIIEYKKDAIKAHNVRYQFIKNYNPLSHYILCHNNRFPQQCYDNMAKDEIYTILRKIGPSNVSLGQKLIKEATLSVPFEQTEKNILIQAKKLFHPLKTQLDLAAQKLWTNCQNTPKKSGYFPNVFLDYQGQEYYVHPASLYCLNNNIPLTVEAQLSYYKLKIDQKNDYKLSSEEKSFLYPMALNYFKQSLDMALKKTAIHELQNHYHYFFTEDKNLKNELKKNDYLKMQILSIDDWNNRCLETLKKYYPKSQYYSTGDLHGVFGLPTCKEFYLDHQVEFEKMMASEWLIIEKTIISLFENQTNIHAKTCSLRHPASFTISNEDTNISSESYARRVCLHKAKEMAKHEVLDWWKVQRSYQFQNQYFLNIWHKLQ